MFSIFAFVFFVYILFGFSLVVSSLVGSSLALSSFFIDILFATSMPMAPSSFESVPFFSSLLLSFNFIFLDEWKNIFLCLEFSVGICVKQILFFSKYELVVHL